VLEETDWLLVAFSSLQEEEEEDVSLLVFSALEERAWLLVFSALEEEDDVWLRVVSE